MHRNLRRCRPSSLRLAVLSLLPLFVLLPATPAPADEPGTISAAPWTPADDDPTRFRLSEVFELEWANDPRISPDGRRIVYERGSMDVMHDRRRSNLWLLRPAASDDAADAGEGRFEHLPLTTGPRNDSMPRWSPDGSRVAYVSKDDEDGPAQIWVRWLESGSGERSEARLTQVPTPPRQMAWSPDGRHLAFTRFVEEKTKPMVKLPPAPEGAEWADAAIVIDQLVYRADGAGYLPRGFTQLFVVPAEGGTPRQVTSGPYEVQGTPVWTPDGGSILFTSNRVEDWRHDPRESEIYSVHLESLEVRSLTDRDGPDGQPALSPDGRHLAWVGFDDRLQGYQVARLSVMELDGLEPVSEPRLLAADLDRTVESPTWSADGSGVYVGYSDEGNGKVGFAGLDGSFRVVAEDVGGTSLGRPYASGSFTVGGGGGGDGDDGNATERIAFTRTRPERPADVALANAEGDDPADVRHLTRLNDDLFGHKELGEVEEIWWESSHDGRRIQGWIVKPPSFDEAERYPMILEIHGGPFADYGDRFTAEAQLYAAAGYVVLYANPRGSSSYGEEFGNLIHHAYPSHDYDDLMSGVNAVLARGYVDEDHLFVTGGSGGGVLSAWIVGHTDRFRAAVVAKPVINWESFVLTADNGPFFWKYWFPGFPWEHPENYRQRSPLTYVGNVTTPTMLLTGEADYRTPISESEQFYQALQLRRVDSALVRIPGASHGIARRPSHLMSKVAHVLAWFERYRVDAGPEAER